MSITRELFGTAADGTAIDLYTLTNANGLQARITPYGGTLVALLAPDRAGQLADVLLGFDELAPYLNVNPYFGSLVGRYGNRIARGRFQLNGVQYQLARNDGPNHLHGGLKGFDKVLWQALEQPSDSAPGLELSYLSADGEEGYPGNLSVRVRYTLTEQNALRIDYQAETDRDTVLNLTNHAYFNLAGQGDILAHELELAAERFLPVDETLIPTGQLQPVWGTPLDFTAPTPIGARIHEQHKQLLLANGGYDQNWVLDAGGGTLAFAARVYEPDSGRVMEVYTTQPGVQFYSSNFLDDSLVGKGGQSYAKHCALCLETQHFPDSPNQLAFPSTLLRPGESYAETTVYQFSVRG